MRLNLLKCLNNNVFLFVLFVYLYRIFSFFFRDIGVLSSCEDRGFYIGFKLVCDIFVFLLFFGFGRCFLFCLWSLFMLLLIFFVEFSCYISLKEIIVFWLV